MNLGSTDTLKAAARFHGHIGPWIILGLRAGRHAKRVLGGTPFQLHAVVHCPDRTPYSCLLDGVQFGSGCTMGKGNIRHVRSERVWMEFRKSNTKPNGLMSRQPSLTGASITIALTDEAWNELHARPRRTPSALSRLAREYYRRSFKRLFRKTRRH